MFRMWGKIWKNNHMIKDTVIDDVTNRSRTEKVFAALDEIVYQFEISRPIWLDSCVKDFQKFSKVRFNQDCFIDEIEFDYLEIQMIEED